MDDDLKWFVIAATFPIATLVLGMAIGYLLHNGTSLEDCMRIFG